MIDSLAIVLTEAEKAAILLQTHEFYENAFIKLISSIALLMVIAGAIIPFGGYFLMNYNLKKHKQNIRQLKKDQSELENKIKTLNEETFKQLEKAREEWQNESIMRTAFVLGNQVFANIRLELRKDIMPDQKDLLLGINYLHNYIARGVFLDRQNAINTLEYLIYMYALIESPFQEEEAFRDISHEKMKIIFQDEIKNVKTSSDEYIKIRAFLNALNKLKVG